jgi:hypothetical protein
MGRLLGLAGIVLIFVGLSLIRFPVEGDEGIAYSGLFVSERTAEYPIYVEVVPIEEGEIGVSLEDQELDFGVLSQGMVARKTIKLESASPVRVMVWAEGNISDMVGFSSSDFVMDGSGEVEVSLEASGLGNYSGMVYISSRVPNYSWLGGLTPWI